VRNKALLRNLLLLITSSLLLLGWVGAASEAGASSHLASSYSGSFRYSNGMLNGTMTLTHVSESAQGVVHGTVRYSSGGGGKISKGSVKGTTIRFTVVCLASLGCENGAHNDTVKFLGTVSSGATTLKGTFNNTTDGTGGTWQVNKSS
jgi:hypothetical protein